MPNYTFQKQSEPMRQNTCLAGVRWNDEDAAWRLWTKLNPVAPMCSLHIQKPA